MEIDSATRYKFDEVLKRVKEPQSGLSVSEIGLVSRFTYSAAEKTIIVHFDFGKPNFVCPTCTEVNGVVNGIVRESLERLLREELVKEFPGFAVEFLPALKKD
jgi:hypothetical protein